MGRCAKFKGQTNEKRVSSEASEISLVQLDNGLKQTSQSTCSLLNEFLNSIEVGSEGENSEEEDEPELRLATIEIYGHSPKPIDVNVDIMSYWEEKKFTYPRLYCLAKSARASLWIPSFMKEPDNLLRMLQRCNPSLPTHDWKAAKIEEMPGPTSQALCLLRVYNSDSTPTNGLSDKPAEEDITEEIECPELPELDGYVSDASTITRDLSALCTRADQEVILDVASDANRSRTQIKQWWRLYLQMSLKILQVNLHHGKAASAALLLRLAGEGADVVLIQQSWTVGKVSGLRTPKYKLFVTDSQALATMTTQQ
ncbi:hypothetical protein ACLKA6_007286 [Drosophila palustris]